MTAVTAGSGLVVDGADIAVGVREDERPPKRTVEGCPENLGPGGDERIVPSLSVVCSEPQRDARAGPGRCCVEVDAGGVVPRTDREAAAVSKTTASGGLVSAGRKSRCAV